MGPRVRHMRSILHLIAAAALAVGATGAMAETAAAGSTAVIVYLVASANPACVNQNVGFTITVQAANPQSNPTGTVTLTENGTTVGTAMLNGFGQALIGLTFSAAGSYVMLATYSGDSTFAPGSSAPLTEVITSCGPSCREADGDGDFNGSKGKGNVDMDDDHCEDGQTDHVDSSNRGDGKDFHSTQIQSTTFDSGANTVTITGTGTSAGQPVTFTLVALETANGSPGWVSFAFSDGFSNAGSLASGSIQLH